MKQKDEEAGMKKQEAKIIGDMGLRKARLLGEGLENEENGGQTGSWQQAVLLMAPAIAPKDRVCPCRESFFCP